MMFRQATYLCFTVVDAVAYNNDDRVVAEFTQRQTDYADDDD